MTPENWESDWKKMKKIIAKDPTFWGGFFGGYFGKYKVSNHAFLKLETKGVK